MNFLTESSEIFDNRLTTANIAFMEAISIYTEAVCEDIYFTEKKKEKDTFIVSIKKFFANLISAFQSFVADIQIEIDHSVRSSDFKNKLRKLHSELYESKKQGIKTVSVCDVWTMKDKYLKCTSELKKYAKKFAGIKYKRLADVDDDITSFNKIMNSYKQELQEASEKMITVDLSQMLDFVEDEINGRSKVMQTLNDAITLLQQMQKDCEFIEKRRDILGPDVIPKHIGFLRKIAMDISNFFKKWAVKIITTVVLFIG